MSLPSDAPAPRLCFIAKTYPEQEYGFNLHAERGKGQYIGEVDEGSPAHTANLQPGDRILGVNGALVDQENHKQVVTRIKENPVQCELFVITQDGEVWYRERGIPITMSLPNIISCSAQQIQQSVNDQLPEPYNPPPEPPSPPAKEPPAHIPSPPPPMAPQARHRSDSAKPQPRLCKILKHSSTDEFGFNLHAERGRGHFIGKVDGGSISDDAGLEIGQRIVGVNGELIYPNTPHKDVVFLIKKDPMCAELLVASELVDQWYRERGCPFSFGEAEGYEGHGRQTYVPVTISPPITEQIEEEKEEKDEVPPPPPPPLVVNGHAHPDEPVSNHRTSRSTSSSSSSSHPSKASSHHSEEVTTIAVSESPVVAVVEREEKPTPGQFSTASTERYEENSVSSSPDRPSSYTEPKQSPSPVAKEQKTFAPTGHSELDNAFRLSAAEMREQLSRRRRVDPKTDTNMTLQQKYNIVANM